MVCHNPKDQRVVHVRPRITHKSKMKNIEEITL